MRAALARLPPFVLPWRGAPARAGGELLLGTIAHGSGPLVHEIIALGQRLRGSRRHVPKVFSIGGIEKARFVALDKAPDKALEHRAERLIARATARLEDTTRVGIIDKLARRVHKSGKLRLFRLWKMLEPALLADAPTRPFAEHLAWLRRSRSRRL